MAVVATVARVPSASAAPVIALGQLSVAPGTSVHVTGAGWPGAVLVHVETCGNEATNGSADCSLSTAIDVATLPSGEFSALLPVTTPPTPCPCVVRASIVTGDAVATRPIEIPGAPLAPVKRRPLPNLSDYLLVSGIRFERRPGWSSWFGASFSRTLVLTIGNIGPDRVNAAELEVTSGRGNDPTGFVAAPRVGPLEQGASTTVRVAVPFDAMSFGTYRVKVRISGFGHPIVLRRGTSTYPWALFVSAALLAQLVLLTLRNRARRRLLGEEAVVAPPLPHPAPARVSFDLPPAAPAAPAAPALAPDPVPGFPPAVDPTSGIDALIVDACADWAQIRARSEHLLGAPSTDSPTLIAIRSV